MFGFAVTKIDFELIDLYLDAFMEK